MFFSFPDKSDPFVVGASFLGMFLQSKDSAVEVKSADLSASTTLVAVESLEEGQKLCVGLGRWNPKNKIVGDPQLRTVHFNVRRL